MIWSTVSLLLFSLGNVAAITQPIGSASEAVCKNQATLGSRTTPRGDRYLIGVGKADITGPVVELALAGYGKFEQAGSGLRQRLYSRAFIMAGREDPNDRLVYLVLDDLAGDTAVRYGVVEALAASGGEYALYNQQNIAMTATHTHSGPGGWFNYLIPQAPTLGLDKQSFQAVVDGVVLSIKRAHDSLEEGYLDIGTTELHDASINRAPAAYLMNPKEERDKYASDVDTTMTVLRFQRASDDKNVGVLTFFPVHGTSVYNNNTHVSGDNKGVAAWMFEKAMQGDDSAAEGFVAGFSQTNEGDVSPNVLGFWCDDGSGNQCDPKTATCGKGNVGKCRGRGPEYRANDFGIKSCYEIGRRQYVAAKEAYESIAATSIPIRGRVRAFHFFHDMSYSNFTLPDGSEIMTCPAAFGYSTLAGCTDGEGMPGFEQGILDDLPSNLWTFFFTNVKTPTKQQRECHAPKPVLFDAGVSKPYPWSPSIVDMQMLRIGQVFIAVSPSEVTTMSGRRWREAIEKEARAKFDKDAIAMVAGPGNTYAHYVTTPEEYAGQLYSAASTIFGPNQLAGYINLTVSNMHHLADEASMAPVQVHKAPDNRRASLSLFPGVFYDTASRPYGSVITQPAKTYKTGDVIKVRFQGANPRNNLRQEDTFAAVDMLVGGKWVRVQDDSDWFLVYTWRRTSLVLGRSVVDVTWETQADVDAGTYRIRYFGDRKKIFAGVESFEGTSDEFTITN